MVILYGIIFIFVLFLYIHIYHHVKKSVDLEVYNITYTTPSKLNEICDIRQPVFIESPMTFLTESMEELCDKYPVFDVNVMRNNNENGEKVPIQLSLTETMDLFLTDKSCQYISEKNEDFLKETGLVKVLKARDSHLRPPMTIKCRYDLMLGHTDTFSTLSYHHDYRHFIHVQSGSVKVKLIPPNYSKYLYLNENYEEFEFTSRVNPWNVQEDYGKEFGKVKVLDVSLKKGDTLYVPAYWWYSIYYNEMSSICVFKYMTPFNVISIIPKLFLSMLQRSNIKHVKYKYL